MSDAGSKGRVSDEATCTANCLTEKDIPGASLNGRDPVVLTIPQLKRWLLCRNASTKGKKADLVARLAFGETSVHICISRVPGRRLMHYIRMRVCLYPAD